MFAEILTVGYFFKEWTCTRCNGNLNRSGPALRAPMNSGPCLGCLEDTEKPDIVMLDRDTKFTQEVVEALTSKGSQ